VLKKNNVETPFNYQKIADEMTAQSVELMATLKSPCRFAITEAERLRAMGQANGNIIKPHSCASKLTASSRKRDDKAPPGRVWRVLIGLLIAAGG
jgi:hypothetical protein